jgi:uncharacterized SAM-binding protein YcdF (DUF218 family)
MLFIFSKIVGFFTSPINLLVLTLTVTFVFFKRSVWLAILIFLLIGIFYSPISSILILPLEERFPRPAQLPQQVDGIIALGGAIDTHISTTRDLVEFEARADRVIALVELGKKYPQAKLVFSGGAFGLLEDPVPEALRLASIFLELGLAPGRVILEPRSLNTFENAIYSRQLVDPKPGETWLLITSAFHMPRSVGIFRKAGWEVIAYPVDYQTTGWDAAFKFSGNTRSSLDKLELAMKEWVGLLSYWLLGRTSALFPAP